MLKIESVLVSLPLMTVLRYGLTSALLPWSVESVGMTDHTVRVSDGLTPMTTFYYAITDGAGNVLKGPYSFTTSPLVSAPSPNLDWKVLFSVSSCVKVMC